MSCPGVNLLYNWNPLQRTASPHWNFWLSEELCPRRQFDHHSVHILTLWLLFHCSENLWWQHIGPLYLLMNLLLESEETCFSVWLFPSPLRCPGRGFDKESIGCSIWVQYPSSGTFPVAVRYQFLVFWLKIAIFTFFILLLIPLIFRVVSLKVTGMLQFPLVVLFQ